MAEQIKVCDGKKILDLPLHERSLSFLTYILRVTDRIETDFDKINFAACDVKFGKGSAKWVTAFYEQSIGHVEYWIIYLGDDATGLVTKYFDVHGNYKDCAYSHFLLMEIDVEGVRKLIEKLPNFDDVVVKEKNLLLH